MNDEYKDKFVAFLEGIEMQNIIEFIELPVADIKATGTILKIFMRNSNCNPFTELNRLDSIFRNSNDDG